MTDGLCRLHSIEALLGIRLNLRSRVIQKFAYLCTEILFLVKFRVLLLPVWVVHRCKTDIVLQHRSNTLYGKLLVHLSLSHDIILVASDLTSFDN